MENGCEIPARLSSEFLSLCFASPDYGIMVLWISTAKEAADLYFDKGLMLWALMWL